MSNITCKSNGNRLKIYINNTLHLSLDIYNIQGIKSEIDGPNWYTITFYIKNAEITSQYGNKEIWENILKLLDEHLL